MIKDLLEVLVRDRFKALARIEICETITGARRRNKLRQAFKCSAIDLVLSDRQNEEDEPTDSEADSDDEEDS